MDVNSRKFATVGRWGGIAFGLLTHLFFAITVWHVFFFLRATHDGFYPGNQWGNVALALQFAIPHSLLLHRSVRDRLTWIPTPFYGCFFTVVTMISFWLIFLFWRQDPVVLWQATGWTERVIQACYLGSWVVMLYSIGLSGYGWQTGWTPWYAWVQGKPHPRREFRIRSAYRFLRHPVYLGFLGLVWCTPTWTWDRVMLTGIWTAYIFIGSVLKDERLAFYMGNTYRAYQEQVPGYPFFWFGPLARRKAPPATVKKDAEVLM